MIRRQTALARTRLMPASRSLLWPLLPRLLQTSPRAALQPAARLAGDAASVGDAAVFDAQVERALESLQDQVEEALSRSDERDYDVSLSVS